ncbi:hypothetical protein GALL_450780 [mine drainage metagenome]|uniref:Uncharacterized protein n=1 Tax=mine drainage metagenome TaxID=410659 RepID=A0A1J5QBE2_9ZZZZ
MLAFAVPAQLGVRQGHAQHPRLLDRGVDELLSQVVVGDALDAPAHALRAVAAGVVGRAEHHQAGPPPAVHRVLHQVALARRAAAHHREQRVVALALVEALLAADADHRPRVRRVRAAAQRNLVHDRRAVDQPADDADVGPVQRRVVEDRAVLGLAGVQLADQFVARHAQRLRRGVQVQAVAAFVLHLGEQDGLALEGRRAGDPVALGQHADDFRMRMLADLPNQRLAVMLGHPVLGLDEPAVVDPCLEAVEQLLLGRGQRNGRLVVALGHQVHGLGVHAASPRGNNGRAARAAQAPSGRWSITRRALPTRVRSIESDGRTQTRVLIPTSVLMRCVSHSAICCRSASPT